MICIGLYEWPLRANVPAYRGLYRGNSLIHLSQSRERETFFAWPGTGAALRLRRKASHC